MCCKEERPLAVARSMIRIPPNCPVASAVGVCVCFEGVDGGGDGGSCLSSAPVREIGLFTSTLFSHPAQPNSISEEQERMKPPREERTEESEGTSGRASE